MIAVVYWSGTGNTKQMAEAIARFAKPSANVWHLPDNVHRSCPFRRLFFYEKRAYGRKTVSERALMP